MAVRSRARARSGSEAASVSSCRPTVLPSMLPVTSLREPPDGAPPGRPRMLETKILIVEDQEDLLRGLEINLIKEGYKVLKAPTGEDGLRLALAEAPHLVLLDVMLPGMSGIDVCPDPRRQGVEVPVIFLTAKSDEIDRVVGLETGADDYVVKPFSLPELLARI